MDKNEKLIRENEMLHQEQDELNEDLKAIDDELEMRNREFFRMKSDLPGEEEQRNILAGALSRDGSRQELFMNPLMFYGENDGTSFENNVSVLFQGSALDITNPANTTAGGLPQGHPAHGIDPQRWHRRKLAPSKSDLFGAQLLT